jgi:hypothetical protein
MTAQRSSFEQAFQLAPIDGDMSARLDRLEALTGLILTGALGHTSSDQGFNKAYSPRYSFRQHFTPAGVTLGQCIIYEILDRFRLPEDRLNMDPYDDFNDNQ